MSTVNVQGSHDAPDSVGYALYGRGAKARRHKAQGTTRAVALTLSSSTRTPEDFAAKARALAFMTRRTVELHTYTHNFDPDEFDVNNPDDIQRVNDLGVALMERMETDSGEPCVSG